jgi:hypothetical protein
MLIPSESKEWLQAILCLVHQREWPREVIMRYLDAGLLFCCMDMLQIDHNNLMQDEPPLYREVQGVARCARASRTARQRG